MKTKKAIYLILFGIAIMLNSCQSTIDFKKLKEGSSNKSITSKSITSIESISSYNVRFNPKANGTIVIRLSNGAEYKADKLNSSQLSSLLTLIEEKGLQFDTKNEEFVLNK